MYFDEQDPDCSLLLEVDGSYQMGECAVMCCSIFTPTRALHQSERIEAMLDESIAFST